MTDAAVQDVLAGELDAWKDLAELDPDELFRLWHSRPRVLRAAAVVRVLERLRSHPEEAEAVSAWATFIRSGLIPDRSRRPERPLNLEWETSSEDSIVRAVGRMSELGDTVDGTIGPEELSRLLDELTASGSA